MSTFLDGPAKGAGLMLARAPLYLRVVIDQDGKVDALDQPEDEPSEGEAVYVYYRVTQPVIACVRHGKGRGAYRFADYRHAADVNGEAYRDNAAWRAWASGDPLRLAPA